MELNRICVYCGAVATRDAAVEKEIRDFGKELALRGIGLVYGGSSLGMMGVLADEVIAAGGKVIGVIPEALVGREAAHKKVTELKVVNTMHDRDQAMFDLGDAFVAFPGGFGTLDQVLEMITWKQLGITASRSCREHRRLLQPLLQQFETPSAGYAKPEHRILYASRRTRSRSSRSWGGSGPVARLGDWA